MPLLELISFNLRLFVIICARSNTLHAGADDILLINSITERLSRMLYQHHSTMLQLLALHLPVGCTCSGHKDRTELELLYLSVGSTWTYLELPATKVTTASSMAAAGMAKPMVQLTLSCTYTRVVTARKEPRLIAK